ncbi:hypothetical protein [Kribbella sp. NPDC055071]
MAVRSRAFMPLVVLIVMVTAVACSKAEGADYPGGSTVSAPPIILSKTPSAALKPAKDCSQSTKQLTPISEMEGVRLTISTDPAGTSLLLKNTGSQSVVVIPDANFRTRLIAAPYANPTDQASRAALLAVNSSGSLTTVHEIPAFVPAAQVVILPPLWAVCALTDVLTETASVRYLRDKPTSAEYYVTKGLADQLIRKFTAKSLRPTLVACAKATLDLLKGAPDITDVELYADILGSDSACRAQYKALLKDDEQATQQIDTTVLNQLQRTPRLVGNTRLFDVTAKG